MGHRVRPGRVGVIGLCAAAGMAMGQCPRELNRVTGVHSLDDFGHAVAWIGDVDRDGRADYAISAPRESGAAPASGVVRVYSGRDGSLLLNISGSMTGELFGWSIAAAGDVNGDGVPDLLIGAPRSDGFTTPANTQPAKIRPAIDGLATQRVDFVCGAGDSNHFFSLYGYNAGLQVALSQRVPCFATEIHTPNENDGLVLGRWGSYTVSGAGGPLGKMVEAPGILGDEWFTDRVPATQQTIHRYSYFEPEAGMPGWLVHGVVLQDYHPIGIKNRLRFTIDYGVFSWGGSAFQPELRRGDFPFTLYRTYDTISTGPVAQDEMRRVEFELPADPSREGELWMRWLAAGAPDMTGPAFLLWMRGQNPDQQTGYSFNNLWAVGGRSARDAAAFYFYMPNQSLTNYFTQLRRLQGPDKKIVIYIEEGGNDRVDPRPSMRSRGQSWSPEGFRDNMEYVRERILEVWSANGWPESELYFMLLGYHVLRDDPSTPEEARLVEIRRTTRELAAEWPRTTCIDLGGDMMTEAEADAKSFYSDDSHAHLSSLGFSELSRRIMNSLMSPPPMPGRVAVVSGADGSMIRELNGGVDGDRFGWSLATVGDLDGDGLADFAVGAPQTPAQPGYVRLISAASGAVIRTIDGASTGDSGAFGSAVAALGDMNGDGLNDVGIGAPESGGGAVLVCSGANGSELRRIDGTGADRLGYAIAGPGDVDGDLVPDIAIGAPGAEGLGPGAGAARVYSGATGAVLLSWLGEMEGDEMGASIARMGDVNQDGVADLVVGAPGTDGDGGSPDLGLALVVSGADGSTLDAATGVDFRGRLGSRIAAGMDADGDSWPDLLVSSTAGPGTDVAQNPAGMPGWARLLSGQLSCCYADFNADGTVDFSDYLEFLTRYDTAQMQIDLTGDGTIDFADYLEFLSLYDSFDPLVDFNDDGFVDFQDYLVFLNRYEAEPLLAAIDLNHDGTINFQDYLEFLNLYDSCSGF